MKAKVAKGFRWIESAKRPRAVLGLPEARQQRCSPNPRCPGESPCTADPKSWLGASDNIRDIVKDPNMDPKSLSKLIRQYLYDPRKKQGSPKTTLQILRGILAVRSCGVLGLENLAPAFSVLASGVWRLGVQGLRLGVFFFKVQWLLSAKSPASQTGLTLRYAPMVQ